MMTQLRLKIYGNAKHPWRFASLVNPATSWRLMQISFNTHLTCELNDFVTFSSFRGGGSSLCGIAPPQVRSGKHIIWKSQHKTMTCAIIRPLRAFESRVVWMGLEPPLRFSRSPAGKCSKAGAGAPDDNQPGTIWSLVACGSSYFAF